MRWSGTKATVFRTNTLRKVSYLAEVQGKRCEGELPVVSVLASLRRTEAMCLREAKANALYAPPSACCVDCLNRKLLAGTCGWGVVVQGNSSKRTAPH